MRVDSGPPRRFAGARRCRRHGRNWVVRACGGGARRFRRARERVWALRPAFGGRVVACADSPAALARVVVTAAAALGRRGTGRRQSAVMLRLLARGRTQRSIRLARRPRGGRRKGRCRTWREPPARRLRASERGDRGEGTAVRIPANAVRIHRRRAPLERRARNPRRHLAERIGTRTRRARLRAATCGGVGRVWAARWRWRPRDHLSPSAPTRSLALARRADGTLTREELGCCVKHARERVGGRHGARALQGAHAGEGELRRVERARSEHCLERRRARRSCRVRAEAAVGKLLRVRAVQFS